MRILYGVVGEGMGHAMRSAVLLDHLTAAGHELRIFVSGRAAAYLESRFPGSVIEITGLTMVYEDNEVDKLKTAWANLKSIFDLPENFQAYAETARTFAPDVVVSDFESLSYLFAKGQHVPIVSVDNMQIISRCHHDDDIVEDDMSSFLLTKGIVRAKLPRCNAYLITTFFYPPLKRPRTTLHPPILRPSVLAAKSSVRIEDHVLVYQSGTSHDALVQELEQVDAKFKVYGLRRDLTEAVTEGKLTHCPFSEPQFIDDLASCRAVIAGGGFTLMGEAVFMGKPMLSVPLSGQFEQILNANYLAKLGYGARADEISAAGVTEFLERLDFHRAQLAEFEHDGNDGLLAQLDRALVAAVDEGARGF